MRLAWAPWHRRRPARPRGERRRWRAADACLDASARRAAAGTIRSAWHGQEAVAGHARVWTIEEVFDGHLAPRRQGESSPCFLLPPLEK